MTRRDGSIRAYRTTRAFLLRRRTILDFEFFGLDYDMGKNRMGLVFDPKWGQLQLENFNEDEETNSRKSKI